jgi:GNAT superfamily N-acetyltransferase
VSSSEIKIVDIAKSDGHKGYLCKCLALMPFREYTHRKEYLERAFHTGFHKKLLIFDGHVVGTIEYAPSEASGYPIIGDDVIDMNCMWVLRKAKGHNFGKILVDDMVKSEGHAAGLATIALENHWSAWFTEHQIEKPGFKPIDSLSVSHKTKHKEQVFSIHLVWMPRAGNSEPPSSDTKRLLEGETLCLAHPLCRPQTWKGNVFVAK